VKYFSIPPLGPAAVEVKSYLFVLSLLPITGFIWCLLIWYFKGKTINYLCIFLFLIPVFLDLILTGWLFSSLPKPVAEVRQIFRGELIDGFKNLFLWFWDKVF
jgi:hypothetical protein